MSADGPLVTLRARYVFPIAAPPIAGGMVTLRGTQIVAVGAKLADGPVRDLGDVAILPALVNAHTHLEFSGLSAPLGVAGMSLVDWIRQVVAVRRSTSDAGASGVAAGLRESLACGTLLLGEIATSDWRQAQNQNDAGVLTGMSVRMFHESIAPVSERVAPAVAAAEAFLTAGGTGHVSAALSPHAPYTVHPALLDALVALGRRHAVPLAMHLAESREEIELLATGGGPFARLFQDFDAWDPRPAARFGRVLEYLQRLAQAPRALVIHGNYLDDEETRFLAEHAATMSVVYCPRTHHFFRHEGYPLADMLRAGVSMALGTDSRGSNPDLDMLTEMRFAAAQNPDVNPATILELGTLGGARALGWADRAGTLEAGKSADLAVVQITSEKAGDPHELIFALSTRVAQTWARGRVLYDAAK